MLTFLTIVAAVAVGVVLALAVVVVTAKWWFSVATKRWASGLTKIAGTAGLLPPPRIGLRVARGLEWDDAATLDEVTRSLRGHGFEPAGDFLVAEMHGVRVRGLVHERDRVLAAVTEHPAAGLFSDVVQVYDDDRAITVTSSPETGLEPPPWKTEVRESGADIERLWALFGERRLDATPRPATVEGFVAAFETAYAREMAFHIDRGGPTGDEIRAMARLGGDDATDEAIDAVRGVWNDRVRGMLDRELRASFVATTTMSAAEWEAARDRLVIVHDRVETPEMDELFSDCISWEDEDAARALCDAAAMRRGDATGREAFALMNGTLPAAGRFELVGGLTEPVPADVYVEPIEPDDDLAAAA